MNTKPLILAAKRLGVDAYETQGTVKALAGARWVTVTTEHQLRKIAARSEPLKLAAQWMTRNTAHPYAY